MPCSISLLLVTFSSTGFVLTWLSTLDITLLLNTLLYVCRSFMDYLKAVVFFYSYWFTLIIVFVTGTARISLFCMGYLLGCFICLWYGEDMLIKPINKLVHMWAVYMFHLVVQSVSVSLIRTMVSFTALNVIPAAVSGWVCLSVIDSHNGIITALNVIPAAVSG